MSPSGISQIRISLIQWFTKHTNIVAYRGQGSHSEKVMMNISGFTDSSVEEPITGVAVVATLWAFRSRLASLRHVKALAGAFEEAIISSAGEPLPTNI